MENIIDDTVNVELLEAQKDAIATVIAAETQVEYAKVEDSKVVNVILVEDSAEGQSLISSLDGLWIKLDMVYPLDQKVGVGWSYDASNNSFKPEKPFPSWNNFDEEVWGWTAPTPKPVDEFHWYWSEDDMTWIKAS